MPELNWIGKQAVRAHHREVDFHLLKDVPELACEPPHGTAEVESGNLIVQGDNLLALKALLPRYAGQVKCIYIDPPYNTGNEGWVYNDNVKAPEIQKWLQQVVGKEAEDLSRHDKWLCMMYPRLQLLKRFLREDGSIWVSMDDSEVHLLRCLMDEVFGREKFVACNVWQKRYSRENRGAIGDVHEYIMVYALNPTKFQETRNLVPLSEEQSKIYKNPNNDVKGRWRGIPMTAQGFRPNQMYDIVGPDGTIHRPPEGRCWSTIEPEFIKLREAGRIWFGKDGRSQPNTIRYLSEVEGFVPWTWWPHDDVGHTDEARKEVQTIFGTQTAFDTPKPTRLIQRILQIATDKDSIVLDSFAGSGTTGHAVLKQNAEDGGTRRFILVEMEEKIARTITAERVRRVIMKGAAASRSAAGSDSATPLSPEGRTVNDPPPVEAAGLSNSPAIGMSPALGSGAPLTPHSRRRAARPSDSGVALPLATALQDAAAPNEAPELALEFDAATPISTSQAPPAISMPGFRFAVLGDTLFDAEGNIRETVRFEELAEFVWFQQTGAPMARNDEARMMNAETRSPLLGIHRGTSIYLLFNGILKDKSVGGGNVLTRPVLYSLPEHDGPKVVWCAACRISELHQRRLDLTPKQLPYQLEVNAWL